MSIMLKITENNEGIVEICLTSDDNGVLPSDQVEVSRLTKSGMIKTRFVFEVEQSNISIVGLVGQKT